MRELALWDYLRRHMLGRWHATRIESSAGNGVPDVSWCLPLPDGDGCMEGWLELKNIHTWPSRITTKVKVPLRPEQRHWIKNRGSIGSNIYVAIRIESDIFLLSWQEAIAGSETGWCRGEWVSHSIAHWAGGKIDFEKLTRILRQERTSEQEGMT